MRNARDRSLRLEQRHDDAQEVVREILGDVGRRRHRFRLRMGVIRAENLPACAAQSLHQRHLRGRIHEEPRQSRFDVGRPDALRRRNRRRRRASRSTPAALRRPRARRCPPAPVTEFEDDDAPVRVLARDGFHRSSSGRSRYCSSASGFASASRFLTARPWTTSRTASSTILPLLRPGNVRYRDDAGRHVPRGRIPADLVANAFLQPGRRAVPSLRRTKSTIRSSPFHCCPMTRPSRTSGTCSTCR